MPRPQALPPKRAATRTQIAMATLANPKASKAQKFSTSLDALTAGLSVLDYDADISEAEALLHDEQGQLRVVDAHELARIPQAILSTFCHRYAYYQLVTTELVEYVAEQIRGRSAIEICAGNGCLGRALGLPLTDSQRQDEFEGQKHHFLTGQPAIRYPQDVEKLTAEQAVAKYAPEVVIGAWVCPLWVGPSPIYGGNTYGPDEARMMTRGFGGQQPELYLHVGNGRVHGDKPLFKTKGVKPKVLANPSWLYSRSQEKKANEIYLFTRREA